MDCLVTREGTHTFRLSPKSGGEPLEEPPVEAAGDDPHLRAVCLMGARNLGNLMAKLKKGGLGMGLLSLSEHLPHQLR